MDFGNKFHVAYNEFHDWLTAPTHVHNSHFYSILKNGVNTFAIQFGKQCFAKDKNAEGHYSKLGRPLIPVCMDGRGGFLQNDVYHIKTAAGKFLAL